MLIKKKIAKSYAKGLFEYAQIINKDNELYSDINKFYELITTDYIQFFFNYPLTIEKKIEFIRNNFIFSDIYKYIIEFIIKNKRENLLELIFIEYKKIYHKAKGIIDVTVITAIPLNSVLKNKLVNKISNIVSVKQINVQYLIDNSIIGGIILEYEYIQLNLSIKWQLHNLNNYLINYEKIY
ncbi:MAG: ATP synthase F1 subunit delta [Candidatus Bostrichicola ureolyticus]|nr:MAG: ATP synthase F1 subunit delta [Candidatus Bostrichicola ureolyticus]